MIKIAERLRPFSHEISSSFLLPCTTYWVQVFPTRFYVMDLENQAPPFWVSFDWTGPVKEFTAQLDLEKGGLALFGQAQEGFVRYRIELEGKSLCLVLDNAPESGVEVSSSLFPMRKMKGKERVILVPTILSCERPICQERLSLGNHKAQDLFAMRRRLDPKELFPLWLRLADSLPLVDPPQTREGNYQLLDICKKLIQDRNKQEILPAFTKFFLASFTGLFVPRLLDADYQGLMKEQPLSGPLPLLPLLTESAALIRSLFYRELQPAEISILPCLPPQLHCGRMIGIQTLTGQTVHVEWTKKNLRTMVIESVSSTELRLWLPTGIASCRFKAKQDTLRKIEIIKGAPLVLSLEPRSKVVLDRFEG